MEKTKNSLESENQDLRDELKHLSGAKTDSETRRRKQEQQLQEYNAKLQDTERMRNDLQDKNNKSQVSFEEHFMALFRRDISLQEYYLYLQ